LSLSNHFDRKRDRTNRKSHHTACQIQLGGKVKLLKLSIKEIDGRVLIENIIHPSYRSFGKSKAP